MKETYKIIRFKELSRRAGMHESSLGATRIPKKHEGDFKKLYLYLESFVTKLVNNK